MACHALANWATSGWVRELWNNLSELVLQNQSKWTSILDSLGLHIQKNYLWGVVCAYKFIFFWVCQLGKLSCVHVTSFCNLIGIPPFLRGGSGNKVNLIYPKLAMEYAFSMKLFCSPSRGVVQIALRFLESGDLLVSQWNMSVQNMYGKIITVGLVLIA